MSDDNLELVYVQVEPEQIEAIRLEAQWREISFDEVVSECAARFLEKIRRS
jgi:hypothetical protein